MRSCHYIPCHQNEEQHALRHISPGMSFHAKVTLDLTANAESNVSLEWDSP